MTDTMIRLLATGPNLPPQTCPSPLLPRMQACRGDDCEVALGARQRRDSAASQHRVKDGSPKNMILALLRMRSPAKTSIHCLHCLAGSPAKHGPL